MDKLWVTILASAQPSIRWWWNYFDESEIVSSEASNSGSMGTVDNSTSSGTYTSSETVFGGASNDVLGNESVEGLVVVQIMHIANHP